MNSLKMNSVIYRIQDLVINKELKSFEKFKIHFQDTVKFDKRLRNYKFISKTFKNIYTFLKELQKRQKSIILVQALKPMFEMLLFEMTVPKKLNFFDEEMDEHEYYKNWGVDNFLLYSNRRIIQISYNSFIIPYENEEQRIYQLAIKKRKLQEKLYNFEQNKIKNTWIKIMGLEAYNKEIDDAFRDNIYARDGYSRKDVENLINENKYFNFLDYKDCENEEEHIAELAEKNDKLITEEDWADIIYEIQDEVEEDIPEGWWFYIRKIFLKKN